MHYSEALTIVEKVMDVKSLSEIADSKKAIALLMAIGVIQIVVELSLNGFASFPDSEGYIETVEWYRDGTGEEHPLRIQRPLQILAVLLVEPVLGVEGSFVAVNSVLYLLSVPFFFLFARRLLLNTRDAFASTLLFQTSFCVLYWGLAILTDMLVWLVMAVSFYLLAEIVKSWKMRDIYLLAVVVGIGMVNKESVAAAALVFIFLYMAEHVVRQPEKIRRFLQLIPPLIVMAIPFILVQIAISVYFGPGHSFFDYHLFHNTSDVRGALWYLPVTFGIAFNILLVFMVVGLRGFFEVNSMFTRKSYLICLALAMLPVLAFEQYSPRLSFLVFPFVIPSAAIGLKRLPRLANCDLLYWIVIALLVVSNNAVALFGDELRELLGIWSRM